MITLQKISWPTKINNRLGADTMGILILGYSSWHTCARRVTVAVHVLSVCLTPQNLSLTYM